MAKRWKAIFGNPPFSVPNASGGCPKPLWTKFTEESIKQAEEVYYITPFIWNGRAKKIIADNGISKVDLTAAKHFDVFSSICYWNNHPTDKKKIITTSKGDIEIDNLSDIEYLPFDIDNTLIYSHRKCWAKGVMGITNKRGVDYKLHQSRAGRHL